MVYRKIKKAEVDEYLRVLEEEERDFKATSIKTGVHERTLRRWDSERNVAALGTEIPDLLEMAIRDMLVNKPEFNNGQGWGIALGILIDKLLLVKGKATSRHETISSRVSSMSDEEYLAALKNAESILDRAKENLQAEGSIKEKEMESSK